MRTKTLLLTAALTAAGVATSMAQVYSVNMVGYINQSIPDGYSIIANHLNGSPDNLVTSLFVPIPAETTTFYKWNKSAGQYDSLGVQDGVWEGVTDMTLGPGEAAFIAVPDGAGFTQTFVGDVQLARSVEVSPGYAMLSSSLPQRMPVEGAPNDGSALAPVGLGFPVAEGDTFYRYDNVNNQYLQDSLQDGLWEGPSAPNSPTVEVGEGFFFSRVASGPTSTWARNFVVGVD